MSQRKVTLLVPGYTADRSPFADQVQAADPRFQIDHRVPASFSFSQDLDRQPWQAQLAQILGMDTDGGKRLPGARLGLLGGDESLSTDLIDTTGLVRADPIFLKADRDSATLIPAEQLALSKEESETLIMSLNEFVAEDGLLFFCQNPDQWYMSGRSADFLESFPPSYLASRNASSFLPDGDDAAPWRQLMTEIQMLLHSHPINGLREQRGLMPVNSVWFWGGAPLPSSVADGTDVVIYADVLEVQSLARHVGLTCLPLVQFCSDVNNEFTSRDIVVVDLSIVHAWLNADAHQLDRELARVHEKWLYPLSRLVEAKELEQVHVMTEDGLQGNCNIHTLPALSNNPSGWIKRIRDLFNR